MAKAFISGVDAIVLQEKTVDITENSIVEVIPDEGKLLRKVTAKIDTPVPKEEQEKVVQINGNGTIDILPDTGKVLSRVTAVVNVEGGSDAPDVPDEPVTPEYSEGLEYEYDSDYGGAVVMGYGTWDAWSGEDLVIPPTCVIDGVEYNVVYIEYNAMQFGGMKTVRLPETIAVLNSGNFCYSAVTHLYIPFIRTVDSWCFLNESNLQHVQFKDVEYIGDSCFHKCSGTVFDFAACTTVPTLDMEYYDSSYNFGTDPVIVVPENLLEEWKQATNWTLYADYIVSYATEADIARGKAAYVDEELITGTMPPASEILGDTGFLSLTWVDVTIGANTITLGDAAHSYLNELAGGYLCAAALLENPTVENQLVIVSGSMECPDMGGNLSYMRTGYRYRSGGLQLTVLYSQYSFVLKEGTRYRLWVLNPNTTNIAPY